MVTKLCIRGVYYEGNNRRFLYAMRALMHRLYRKRLMRGYFKYLKNKYKIEGFGTTNLSHTPSSDIFLQGNGGTFQIFYRVDYWSLLLVWKRNKRNGMGVTSNGNLRLYLKAGAGCLEKATNYSWCNWDNGYRLFFLALA